jgi:poly(3-hydroxybutyrate) depolymerase
MKIFIVGMFWLTVAGCKTTSQHSSTKDYDGTWSSKTIHDVDTKVYLPSSGPKAGRGRALMVNLHGCAQRNIDLEVYGNWEGVADHYGMVVAIPQAPGTNVFMPFGSWENRFSGCWDYYGLGHKRDEGHAGRVLAIIDALVANPELNIDPNQVYVVGFSSGATLALAVACLEPDRIAGVGSNSGPALGSIEADLIVVNAFFPPPFFTSSDIKDYCVGLSNGRPGFDTQIASFIHDDTDVFVNVKHSFLNAHGFAELYQSNNFETFSLDNAGGVNWLGSGSYYKDDEDRPRVSYITNTGMTHAWAAGTISLNMQWISIASIEYPSYVTDFFFANNKRIVPPVQ